MITVWKDGTWKEWSNLDAEHAANDPDWLVNIDVPMAVLDTTDDGAVNPNLGHIAPALPEAVRAVVDDVLKMAIRWKKAMDMDTKTHNVSLETLLEVDFELHGAVEKYVSAVTALGGQAGE